MSTGIIFSGILGSVLGVLVAIGLYWHGRYVSTRRALRDRLDILLHDVHWDCDPTDAFKMWNTTLKEIWVLNNAFMDFAPPFKRSSVRKAWENYKGEDRKVAKNLADQGIIVDSKIGPKNKEEFLHRIASFKKAI